MLKNRGDFGKMEKVKSGRILTLVLIVLVVVLAGYLGYDKIQDRKQGQLDDAYRQGIQDAAIQIQGNMIAQLNTQGFVSFVAPTDDNQTINLRLVPQPTQAQAQQAAPQQPVPEQVTPPEEG